MSLRLRPLAALLGVYVSLGLVYATAVPPLETQDESGHFFHMLWLAEGRGLPVPARPESVDMAQNAAHPPLPYALLAPGRAVFPDGDPQGLLRYNPHVFLGDPRGYGDRNRFLHPAEQALPWRGPVAALHASRGLSVLIGGAVVFSTFLLARSLRLSAATAFLAAALVAFNPKLIATAAGVGNDLPAALSSTLFLAVAVRARRRHLRDAVALGALGGLTLLSKLNGAALLLLGAAVVAQGQRKLLGRGRRAVPALLALGGTASLVSGWWFARNTLILGHPLPMEEYLRAIGHWPPGRPYGAEEFLAELPILFRSFWAIFGWFNILPPLAFHAPYLALFALAAFGLALRRRALSRLVLPLAWLALVLLSYILWNRNIASTTGRLIYPAIGAVAVLMATGLRAAAGGVTRWVSPALLVPALIAPYLFLTPAFHRPPLLRSPRAERPLAVYPGLQLLSAHIGRVTPDGLEVRLRWRSTEDALPSWSVSAKVLDADGTVVAARDATPGGGMHPFPHWRPGEAVEDRIVLHDVMQVGRAQGGLVTLELYAADSGSPVEPRDAEGRPVGRLTLGRIRLGPPPPARPPAPEPPRFGDVIALEGHELTGEPGGIRLALTWRALKAPSTDLTVFVHALDAKGELAGQADGPPQDGAFPTSLWMTGERVEEERRIRLPPGRYRILVGWYVPQTGERLPAFGQQATPPGALDLGWVEAR